MPYVSVIPEYNSYSDGNTMYGMYVCMGIPNSKSNPIHRGVTYKS